MTPHATSHRNSKKGLSRYCRNVTRRFAIGEPDGGNLPRTSGSERASSTSFLQLDHSAPCKGIFLPEVKLWDDVAAGQSLGRIVDSTGRTLAPIGSRRKGHVILVGHSLSVNENEALVVVVESLQKN